MMNKSESALMFHRQNDFGTISKSFHKMNGESTVQACNLEHQKAGNTAGQLQFPIRNEYKLFQKHTSREIPEKLQFLTETKQHKWLPEYNIPQSISFTANHFSLSRCCFY